MSTLDLTAAPVAPPRSIRSAESFRRFVASRHAPGAEVRIAREAREFGIGEMTARRIVARFSAAGEWPWASARIGRPERLDHGADAADRLFAALSARHPAGGVVRLAHEGRRIGLAKTAAWAAAGRLRREGRWRWEAAKGRDALPPWAETLAGELEAWLVANRPAGSAVSLRDMADAVGVKPSRARALAGRIEREGRWRWTIAADGPRPKVPVDARVDAPSTPPAVPREAAAQLLALRAAQRAEAAASARVAEYRAASERARANRDAARAASVIETWTYEGGRVVRRVAGPAMTPAMKGGAPC